MHLHTPHGVRSSVLTLGAFSLIASGVLMSTPAAADATTTPAVTTSAAVATTAAAAPAAVIPATATATTLVANRPTSHPGEAVTLTGRVKLAGTTASWVAAKRVTLQVQSGSTWAYSARAILASDGIARFVVKPKRTTVYRLVFVAAPPLALSYSTATVTVRAYTSAERAAKALAVAKSKTGKWYRWGAAGPNVFDCSGLTQYAYKQLGVYLPHNANAQKSYGKKISRAQARPGDLIIFLSGGHGYHAAIYAGGNYMYDAPHAGAQVGKHKIYSSNIIFRRLV